MHAWEENFNKVILVIEQLSCNFLEKEQLLIKFLPPFGELLETLWATKHEILIKFLTGMNLKTLLISF